MNSYTSNPDEAENSTGKSMKKNIPGLALLLLDLAVALVGLNHLGYIPITGRWLTSCAWW